MITTYATIWKVCGSRDPLRRTVVLSTSGLQEEGKRGVTTIKFVLMTMLWQKIICELKSWPSSRQERDHELLCWGATCCDPRSSKSWPSSCQERFHDFLCSGASGLFHSKQHHWWGVQRSWPLSMGLLWPRNPIPGAWLVVCIRVSPFLRPGVGG